MTSGTASRPATESELIRREIERLLTIFSRFGIDTSPVVPRDFENGQGESSLREPRVTEAVVHARRQLFERLSERRLADLNRLDDTALASLQTELVRLCVDGRLHHYLAQSEVSRHPVYNFSATFTENGDGPWDRFSDEREAVTPIAWALMGLPTRFPVGVPACGLTLNAKWIRYLARRGFNVLTYKTVRSVERPPHRHPQWLFIEDVDPWDSLEDLPLVKGSLDTWPANLSRFSTANSFGVPSPKPSVWQRDVEECLDALDDGQLLIVSVMGTADDDDSGSQLVKDFVKVARQAERSGARAIELNLSCPNRIRPGPESGVDPPLCLDAAAVRTVVEAVRSGLASAETRLIAKLSYMSADLLAQVVESIGNQVDGIAAINTVQARISRPDGKSTPFIGTSTDRAKPREYAGVSGYAIREIGVEFVRNLAAIRDADAYAFDIIGMGGVASPSDVARYFDAGAQAVQSATGACVMPQLPLETLLSGSAPATTSRRRSVIDGNAGPRSGSTHGRAPVPALSSSEGDFDRALAPFKHMPEGRVVAQAILQNRRLEQIRELLRESLAETDARSLLEQADEPVPLSRLLAIVDEHTLPRYPAWQFSNRTATRVVPKLPEVLEELDPLDPVAKGAWLLTESPALQATPLEALRRKRWRAVLAEARGIRAA